MQVTIEVKTDTGNKIAVSGKLETLGDLKRLGAALQTKAAKIRAALPEQLVQKIVSAKLATE
jgi:hypothetical protein